MMRSSHLQGETGHDNSECEYSSWLENSDVVSEESPRAQGMPPKPKTPAPAALYPQVQMSSGGAFELHKRQDRTSLKQGQKKRRRTKTRSDNTTATSSVSLASDVGHVGTQGASESREKARAHSKKEGILSEPCPKGQRERFGVGPTATKVADMSRKDRRVLGGD